MTRWVLAGITGIALVAAAGTVSSLHSRDQQETRLTEEVEIAGAGDLRGVSLQAMIEWFKSHKQVALRIEPECEDRGRRAPSARWGDSLEGRVCRAALPIAAYARFNAVGPGRFVAGN